MILKEEVFTSRYQVTQDSAGDSTFQVKNDSQEELTLWLFPKAADPKVSEIGSHPNLLEIVEMLQGS